MTNARLCYGYHGPGLIGGYHHGYSQSICKSFNGMTASGRNYRRYVGPKRTHLLYLWYDASYRRAKRSTSHYMNGCVYPSDGAMKAC